MIRDDQGVLMNPDHPDPSEWIILPLLQIPQNLLCPWLP